MSRPSEGPGLIPIRAHVMLHCSCYSSVPHPAGLRAPGRCGCVAVTGLAALAPGRQEVRVMKSWVLALWELSSFPHRNRISRSLRKWGRGRQEIYDFRMKQLQMRKKTPCRGSGLFPRLHCPSWKDSSQTQVSHCLELAVSPQGELQV